MNKTVQKSVRINPETVSKLEKLAKKENRTFNNMLETALMEYLKFVDAIQKSKPGSFNREIDTV